MRAEQTDDIPKLSEFLGNVKFRTLSFTTYRTNLYSMPLAMFVGCNNQLQNIVFAQALVRDERADTFEWIFKTFQECMNGKDPITILTGK